MLHFSKLEKLFLYAHLHDGRKIQPLSCLRILSYSPGVRARISLSLRRLTLQSPYQLFHLLWHFSFQGTGQGAWSGKSEMAVIMVPSSTAHRTTETHRASESLMRLKEIIHLRLGSLCGFNSKALTSMLSSGEHSPGKFLYCMLAKTELEIPLIPFLTAHLATQVFRSNRKFYLPPPKVCPGPNPSPLAGQPLFLFAAEKSSKHRALAAVPVVFILFMTPRKTHFWLKNKPEVSVEPSNIFPESTIKIIRLCCNFKRFVQVLMARLCYSFVYPAKSLKSASQQNVFQKLMPTSLCWPKSQEELAFVVIML